MGGTNILDGDNELYGYGLVNVHKMVMVAPTGKDFFRTPEAAEEHLESLVDSGTVRQTSHIRMVQVRLDNEEDKRLGKITL
jgi:hypothetical protein